jgi:DNA-binding MarR family transcriptional regulator
MYVVGRVNQGIRRAMRVGLRPWGLSVQQYTTLSILAARPDLSNAQLARRALVTPQSMLEILAMLERRGLVQRRADPTHGQILRATLTPAGNALLKTADPAVEEIHAQIFDGLSAPERAAAERALRRAMGRLSSAGQPND